MYSNIRHHLQNWYVNNGVTTSGNGTTWTAAWKTPSAINWASVGPGDTIWVAGGTYAGGMTPTKSGTAANRIYFKRVRSTDAVPVAAPGWNPAFDSTVIMGGVFGDLVSYFTIDGQVEGVADGQQGSNDYGIAMTLASGSDGIRFHRSDSIQIKNVQMIGPGWGPFCGYGIFINGQGTGNANHLISHVYIDGVIQQITVGEWKSGIIEYCKLWNAGPGTPACHSDTIYFSGMQNVTVRYCHVYNSWSQSLFTDNSGDNNTYVYGNVLDQGPLGCCRMIETKQGYNHGTWYVYNNTFIGWDVGIYWRGTHSGTSEVKNNIFWNTSWQVASDGSITVASDYNLYSGTKNSLDGSHSISSAANPFVNFASRDYHIGSSSSARNVGVALTANGFIDKDMDGTTRGLDGTWDIGAYEYASGGGGTTNPLMVLSISQKDYGLLKVGSVSNVTVLMTNAGTGSFSGTASATAPFSVTAGSTYTLFSGSNHSITLRYTPTAQGEHTSAATFTGAGGGAIQLNGKAYTNQTGMFWWATNGLVTAPMFIGGGMVQNDGSSSENSATETGYSLLGFSSPSNGYYYFTASARGTNTANDSFYFQVDSAPNYPSNVWDILPITTNTQFRTVGARGAGSPTTPDYPTNVVYLTSGDHWVAFWYREPYAGVSNVVLNSFNTNSGTIPVLLQQPRNLQLILNGSGSLNGSAIGSQPVYYQWLTSTGVLTGATSATLNFSSANAGSVNFYALIASNSIGSVTSIAAEVTLVVAPTISIAPTNSMVGAGRELKTYSTGDPGGDFDAQIFWIKDGVEVGGQNSEALSLNPSVVGDTGSYAFRIRNAYGFVDSATCALTVVSALIGGGMIVNGNLIILGQ